MQKGQEKSIIQRDCLKRQSLFTFYNIIVKKLFGGRLMIEFQCDYAEGAHPKILERLVETNMDQTPGYGLDP